MGEAALAFVNISLLHKLVCVAFCAKVMRMIYDNRLAVVFENHENVHNQYILF